MLESFTLETFAGRIGERFTIRFEPEQATETELVEAVATGEPGPGRTPFSLVFRAPAGDVFPQAIYVVEHDELGSFEIFLVPIAEDMYEAIFS